MRDPRRLRQPSRRQQRPAALELQVRHHREQVGVAGAFAVPVDGALDVRDAGLDRGQRVRDRAAGVVVAVDAEPRAGRAEHVVHHVLQLAWQRAAVGVAERHDLRAGFGSGPDDLQRVGAVRPVAVEEVLGVEEHPLAVGTQVGDRVGDHRQVLVQAGPQRPEHVLVVALGHQRHHARAGLAQRRHQRIGGRRRTGPAGRAEGREGRVLERQFGPRPGEELGVLRHRARPAALDEPDAQVVQVTRDGELVGDGEVEPLLLRAVAQRRVVDVKGVGHAGLLPDAQVVVGKQKTSRDRERSARSGGACLSAPSQ
jgi:hypothetical protein